VSIPPREADTTPAGLLQRAAEDLNHQSPTGTYSDPCPDCGIPGAFLDAVADWLNACALVVTAAPTAAKAHAERVARAYLGDVA
jgi:hypothetical protein